ncbi:YciI family protein [Parasphingorhabdus pacifica]
MAKFVVELVYGEDREHLQAVRPAHREYARELAAKGVLLAGGPFADDTGALLLYEVADEDELREVIDKDPYTEAGVIAETTIRGWTAATGSWLS